MTDRRPSLIDQMAMAAASQILLEEGLDISDSEEESDGMDLLDELEEQEDEDDDAEIVFNTDVPEEAGPIEYEEDLEDLEADEGNDADVELDINIDEVGSASAPSHVGSEDLDEFSDHFADHPLPLEYQWNPRASGAGNHEESMVASFNVSSASDTWLTDLDEKAGSFRQNRRSSFQSLQSSQSSFQSNHSAPARAELDPSTPLYEYGPTDAGGSPRKERRRPMSISVPNAEGVGPTRRHSYSQRRQSVKVRSLTGGTDEDSSLTNSHSGTSSGILGFGRRSTRRQNLSVQGRIGGIGSADNALDNAIESLRTQDSNSEWENVAAAVTVVAAGSQRTQNSKSRHIKFAVNDTVLVFLTLLNVTNMEDPKDTFTVAPVNKFGFPAGEGRTEAEKSGPYTFVLATVKHVHFDEDDRYYTVERADTGTEQRADSGWIEPLTDPEGIEAASRAAKRTVRSAQDKPIEDVEESGYLQDVWGVIIDLLSWPADFSRSKLLPWYRNQRASAKQQVTQLLYGDAPFACKVRVTGINFLVCCSFVFLFLEVIDLAFLPAAYDDEIAIVGVVVWGILVLELIFEVVIRPKGYHDLILSDKAFAPSTARHINKFHLTFEALALFSFLPEFPCMGNSETCKRDSVFSPIHASLDAILGNTHADAARGRFLMGITVLRLFGLFRHWKQMFINNTFRATKREGIEKWLFPKENNLSDSVHFSVGSRRSRQRKKHEDDDVSFLGDRLDENYTKLTSSEEDQRLKNAATIGTALMVVNSQRALILLTAIVLVLPLLDSLTQQNLVAKQLVHLLQANNLASPFGNDFDCNYLETTIQSWLNLASVPQPASLLPHMQDTFVLWAQLLPKRCDFQRDDGVITYCAVNSSISQKVCTVWNDDRPEDPSDATPRYFAEELDIRLGGIRSISNTSMFQGGKYLNVTKYTVTVIYNENPTASLANMGMFILLMGVLILGLYGLTALRAEAIRLVLDPLQRMLKIVLRYAENPLSQDVKGGSGTGKKDDDDMTVDNGAEEIGNYETEQLINAITKIADLLRKCWGVAGAGIISSNLARTKDGKTVVFNPTVPGKRVYALFGFVKINGFSELLRALDRDVMILINDVAKVVHDEVYRWALGDHGQCNKNLGAPFLMVFRIGDFSEVHKKKQVATEKLFRDNAKTTSKKSANLRRRYPRGAGRTPYGGRKTTRHQDDGQLQLASLPGIQAFTDRALLGMLKSFAGIHRDKNLNIWKNDFRLSAGVSAYHVDIIYGMDAGWAVEGAVGSEYKIDATYLSPHVNMASRMMSATKQYGVTILLSKAVEELLSRTCRKKLRHLDTVYVKGSKIKQDIFTFDARHKGVDFFLIERTPEQADMEADSYTPNVWDHDQDLRAMRQHVSDNFMEIFNLGVKQYLGGNWKEAYKNFEKADQIMIETVLEDGFLDYDVDELEGRIFDKNDQGEDIVRVRHELGDGACRVLMTYMERRNLKPPDDWDAVRQLSCK